jgi:F-type H+-transporting ATPase subunit delta
MASVAASSRYAKSLLQLAQQNNVLEVVNTDIKGISTALTSVEFVDFIKSPIINSDKKVSVINALFAGKVNPLTLSFLNLLATKRRESLLSGITASFQEQYNAMRNIIKAEVVTAAGLDETLRQQVYDLIKQVNNSEVEVVEKVDAKIIGGFILNIGSKQYDNSVLRSLQAIKNKLSNN